MEGCVLLLLATLVVTADAKCANLCSGHGYCKENDLCVCYKYWQGGDCSLRTCPFGKAWADVPQDDGSAHHYAECSNRGTCDRSTGVCACLGGYSGMSCGRHACLGTPECSGHGTCETIAELSVDESQAVGGTTYKPYGLYDSAKSRGCKCDPRYTGADCGRRVCPRGDDPLTTEVDITQVSTTSLQLDEVQNVTVASVTAPINGGEATFTYTDVYNGVWTTRPVALPLVKTWNNYNGVIMHNALRWFDTGLTVTMVTTTTTDTAGVEYHTHTLSTGVTASDGSSNAYSLRKGDWLLFSVAGTEAEGAQYCTEQVYADPTVGATDLKTIANPFDPVPCKLFGTVKVYSAWQPARAGGAVASGAASGATYVASISSAGVVTTGGTALVTQSETADTPSIAARLLPGAWVRIYDETVIGAYCDYKIAGGSTTTTTFAVDMNSATSTYVDSTNRAGNGVGSSACAAFGFQSTNTAGDGNLLTNSDGSGNNAIYLKFLSRTSVNVGDVITHNQGSAASPNLQYVKVTSIDSVSADGLVVAFQTADTFGAAPGHGDVFWVQKTYAMAQILDAKQLGSDLAKSEFPVISGTGDTTTCSSGTCTRDIALTDADVDALAPGAIVYIFDDGDSNAAANAGAINLACIGMVSSTSFKGETGVTLTTVPTGMIAGTFTECATASVDNDSSWLVRSANSIVYEKTSNAGGIGSYYDDTDQAPTYFQGVQAGDFLLGSNFDAGAGSLPLHVSHVDPAAANGHAIYFSVGSAPGGRGMYPIIPHHVEFQTYYHANLPLVQTVEAIPFGAGTIFQAHHTGDSAAQWCATEKSYTDSAKEVQRALEELPDRAIQNVNVAMTAASTSLYAYSVTFAGARDAGNQAEVVMNSEGCDVDGCQPRYSGVRVQKVFLANDQDRGLDLTLALNAGHGSAGTSTAVTAATPSAGSATGTPFMVVSRGDFIQSQGQGTKLITTQTSAITNPLPANQLLAVPAHDLFSGTPADGSNVMIRGGGAGFSVAQITLANSGASGGATTAYETDVVTNGAVNANGGDEIVAYNAGSNNNVKFSTMVGTAAQSDGTITLKYATAVAEEPRTTGFVSLQALGDHDSSKRVFYFKSATYEITRGTKESSECSGRGSCDYMSGLCDCNDGYTGEACATQSVLV